MPYILDQQTVEDVRRWMYTVAPSVVTHQDDGVLFPTLSLPVSLRRACRYRTIQTFQIVDLEEDVFLMATTEAFPDEEETGGNVWLMPDFSNADLKKVLERLAT